MVLSVRISPLGEALIGGALPRHVGGRVEQHLEIDRRHRAIARHQRQHRRQIAAGAVAADRHPARHRSAGPPHSPPPSAAPRGCPRPRRETGARAPCGSRPRRRAARRIGQLPAEQVVRVEVADHPAAAVEVQQAGQRLGRRGPGRAVAAQPDRAGRAGAGQVLDLGHLGRFRAAARRATWRWPPGPPAGSGSGWAGGRFLDEVEDSVARQDRAAWDHPYPGKYCGSHGVRPVEFGQMAGAGDDADLVRPGEQAGDARRHSPAA